MLLYLLQREFGQSKNSVTLGGSSWKIVSQDLDVEDAGDSNFACISYSWGKGRESNPFQPSTDISDRTIPALIAAATHRPSSTLFWVDAFCVPHSEDEKVQTLESMGYIYSQAYEVIAVLSSDSYSALEQMRISDRLEPSHLDDLEGDEWASRAWTYQEAVNSRRLYMTCFGTASPLIAGDHFLNCLGFTLSKLQGSAFDKVLQYPRLDALAELIADWMYAGYQERSVLAVMSNMDRRVQGRPEDHFYAMIGAISAAKPSSSDARDPCEVFMALCEQKGDYSFIYAAAPRDDAPSRRWRPAVSGDLRSILPWYCFGEGQPGHWADESLYLDQVIVLEISAIGEAGKDFIEHWLTNTGLGPFEPQTPLSESAFAALRSMGFVGSQDCLSTKDGFFFPFWSVAVEKVEDVIAATGVRWSFGAPGLARLREDDVDSYIPGAFFGRVDKGVTTSVKLT